MIATVSSFPTRDPYQQKRVEKPAAPLVCQVLKAIDGSIKRKLKILK
jgi:hypothetical protein